MFIAIPIIFYDETVLSFAVSLRHDIQAQNCLMLTVKRVDASNVL